MRSPLQPPSPLSTMDRLGSIESKLEKMSAHDNILESKLDAIMAFLKMDPLAQCGGNATSAPFDGILKNSDLKSGATRHVDGRDCVPAEFFESTAPIPGSESAALLSISTAAQKERRVAATLPQRNTSFIRSTYSILDDSSDVDFELHMMDVKGDEGLLLSKPPILLNESGVNMINPRNQ